MDDDPQRQEPAPEESDGVEEELSPQIVPVPSVHKAREWLTVLAAADIPAFRRRHPERGWEVVIADAKEVEAARQELAEYERESRHWPPAWTLPGDSGEHQSGASIGVSFALALFFLITGPYSSQSPWFQTGRTDAELVLGGEWWRIVTALTLHSDFAHMAGNAIALAFIGSAVCRRLGEGAGWMLILGSGMLGNLATELSYRTTHVAVGASTAVFGALGLLAGIRLAEYISRRGPLTWRGLGLPLLVVAAMFSFMGMSPGADLMAHFFGAVAGVILGVPGMWLMRWRQRNSYQLTTGVLAAAIVVMAWTAGFYFT